MRNKDRTRERPTIKLVELSIYRHVVDLIHEHHITNEIRTEHARQWACLMYHAACNVEFQPPVGRTHSWRFSIFYKICRWFIVFGRKYSYLVPGIPGKTYGKRVTSEGLLRDLPNLPPHWMFCKRRRDRPSDRPRDQAVFFFIRFFSCFPQNNLYTARVQSIYQVFI